MNFISNIIPENLISALGWTIMHSLWQGAAAALGFAVVMFFMRRYSARTRYVVGVIALILILAVSVVTFLNIYRPGAEGMPITGGSGGEIALTGAETGQGNTTLLMFFKNYFNRHLPLLVTIWMLGVLVLTLRMAGGYLYNQRLKIHRHQPLPDSWQNRLQTFCRQTGMKKPIKLVESALVKIPMTIGHFKPVILFPLGMVTGLPQDQVEALLAHELAHILRKDYLVNILQNFLDILFFYNPGVRWLSSQVRAEREHCCDDMAVSLSGNSLNVARALTNIQGYDMRIPVPAMAASGKKWGSHSLLARIKRLVNPAAAGTALAAKNMGAVGTVVLLIALLTLALNTNTTASPPALNQDTENQKNTAVQEKESEKQQKQEKAEKEEIKKLAEKLKEHELKLRELEAVMRKQEEKIRREEALMRQQEEKMRQKEVEMRAEEAVMRKQEEKMRRKEIEKRVEETEMRKQEEKMRQKEAELLTEEAVLRKQEEKMRQKEAEMRQVETVMRQREIELRELEKQMRKQWEIFKKILVNELIKDKLITDVNDFEFQFKKGQLFVNGKKQPEALFEKYKKIYEENTGKKVNESGNFKIVHEK